MSTTAALPISLYPVSLVQATDSPLAFDYTANITGQVTFNSVAVNLIQDFLTNQLELDVGSLPTQVNVNEEFTGQYTLPTDPTPFFSDGDITVDLPLLSSVIGFEPTDTITDILDNFGIQIPESINQALGGLETTTAEGLVQELDDLFNLSFNGDGTLTTGTDVTGFDFQYVNATNSFVINGFDPDVVAAGLTRESTVTATGDFTLDIVLSEFVEFAQQRSIEIPSNVSALITLAQGMGMNEIEIASGDFNLNLTTVPVSESVALL